MKEWERERREREKAEEKEFRRIQERDLQRGGRSRRVSDAGYAAEFSTYSAPTVPGYSRARSRSRVRRDSAGGEELTRAMAEMAMDKDWPTTEPESRWEERERRNSIVGGSRRLSINERPRRLSINEYERTRKTSGTPYPTYLAGGQPGAYGAPPSPGRTTYSDRMSPYMGAGGLPSTGGPVYPPGHIYAGKPIPGMQGGGGSGSYRVPSPSPRLSSRQLELPVGFTRPPSLAAPYTCEFLMIAPLSRNQRPNNFQILNALESCQI
ncbi:hypothetical protein JB92DRAFT_390713 [Gautieria morchelliformis]|nr:hypothetical protein JB92DRAFT_390713 [Gautieria morchelliformis]